MKQSIGSIVDDGDALTAVWRGGERTTLPYLWLRDNCGCGECRVEQTTEKRFHVFRVAADLRPQRAAVKGAGSGDEAIALTWPDGHRTRYRTSDLAALTARPRPGIEYWDHRFRPRRFDFGRFLADDRTAADLIGEFLRTGACVLTGAPTAPDAAERLAPRLGPIREVVFERIHNVSVDPGGYSIAHTDLAIAPHNDFTSYHWPPSVQVLHMLANECDGGDSAIVDAFAVVDRLRRERPERFEALCAVPVPFRLFSEEDESLAAGPMVDPDVDGNVRMVRFNTQQMQPIPLWQPRLRDFYAAYHDLSARINADAAQARFRLEAGQMLMTAAHRVLHGRTALRSRGRRHLQDAYFEHDNVRNRLTLLRRTGRI